MPISIFQSDFNNYKGKYQSNLQDDLVKYAKDRDKVIQKRFIEFGLMKVRQVEGTTVASWDSKNPLAKRCLEYFMDLVSGLPLEFVLFQKIMKR